MSVYTFAGHRGLLPGRPLTAFCIESMIIKGDTLTAKGSIAFRDMTELPGPLRNNQTFLWIATAAIFNSELTDWVVRSLNGQRFGNSSLTTAIFEFVRSEVKTFVLTHSECVTAEPTNLIEKAREKGASPPISSDTGFPSDWHVRKKRDSPLHLVEKPPPNLTAVSNATSHPQPLSDLVKKVARIPKTEVKTGDRSEKPMSVVPRHVGPMRSYEGVCVCEELSLSNPRHKFDWNEKTGGLFSDRCFECSCGQRWWCSRPKEGYWNKVEDTLAWRVLVGTSGTPTSSIVHTSEGVYHLDSLRRGGVFIPFFVHSES